MAGGCIGSMVEFEPPGFCGGLSYGHTQDSIYVYTYTHRHVYMHIERVYSTWYMAHLVYGICHMLDGIPYVVYSPWYVNMRILRTMVSGISRVLDPGCRILVIGPPP